MDTAVSSKTGRRRGVTRETAIREANVSSGNLIGRTWEVHILYEYLTEEQRSRRPVFDETLRAEALLALFFVAPRSQILADMLPRRSANKAKIALSSSIQNFSTGS